MPSPAIWYPSEADSTARAPSAAHVPQITTTHARNKKHFFKQNHFNFVFHTLGITTSHTKFGNVQLWVKHLWAPKSHEKPDKHQSNHSELYNFIYHKPNQNKSEQITKGWRHSFDLYGLGSGSKPSEWTSKKPDYRKVFVHPPKSYLLGGTPLKSTTQNPLRTAQKPLKTSKIH